jgi:hypothetical protein
MSKHDPLPEYLLPDGPTGVPDGFENVEPGDYAKSPAELLGDYRRALDSLPESGGGGCHRALLSVANYGRRAGLAPLQIEADLAAAWRGSRKVTAREIAAAVARAFQTDAPQRLTPVKNVDGPRLFEQVCARGQGWTEDELWDASPVRLVWPRERDATELLTRCYEPEEHLFLGAQYESSKGSVLRAADWIERFGRGGAVPEFIVPNTLSGQLGKTKDGKDSYRADSCVTDRAVTVVEFDNIPLDKQIQFFAGSLLNIVALVHSGGRSIHGWVRVNIKTAEEWQATISEQFFDELAAMGVDRSCSNAGRLSRMPGHFRAETGKWQRLLYLNPDGGPISKDFKLKELKP